MQDTDRIIKAIAEISQQLNLIIDLLSKTGDECDVSTSDNKVDREGVKQLLMIKNKDEVLAYLRGLGYMKFSEIPDEKIDAIREVVNEFSDRKGSANEQK